MSESLASQPPFEGTDQLETAIARMLNEMNGAREQMQRDQLEIDRLKAASRELMDETRARLASLQAA